jgi:hypothetical protein
MLTVLANETRFRVQQVRGRECANQWLALLLMVSFMLKRIMQKLQRRQSPAPQCEAPQMAPQKSLGGEGSGQTSATET